MGQVLPVHHGPGALGLVVAEYLTGEVRLQLHLNQFQLCLPEWQMVESQVVLGQLPPGRLAADSRGGGRAPGPGWQVGRGPGAVGSGMVLELRGLVGHPKGGQ